MFHIYGLDISYQCLVSEYNKIDLNFIFITETSFRDYDVINYNFPGYKVADFYCRSHYKRGGVTVFIQNDLNTAQVFLKQHCV